MRSAWAALSGSRVVLAAIAISIAAAAAGQQPPPAAPQPTFRSGVDLVTLDVIPRTSNGQFVPSLGKDDFQVFEDGVAQEIASLVMVHGGRVFNVLAPPDLPAAGSPEGIILPRAAPRPTPPAASSSCSSTICTSPPRRRRWSGRC